VQGQVGFGVGRGCAGRQADCRNFNRIRRPSPARGIC